MRNLFLFILIVLSCNLFSVSYAETISNLPDFTGLPSPVPQVTPPGPVYTPPVVNEPVGTDAPVIFSNSDDVAPDESVFLTGKGFSENVVMFGPSVSQRGGGIIPNKVLNAQPENLIVTPNQIEPDGLYLLWVRNEKGYSLPVRLNAPQPWWFAPKNPYPGESIRIFGRNLTRRPDNKVGFVYLNSPDRKGVWLKVQQASKYELNSVLPNDLEPGNYEIWVHAGMGGKYGWSEPLKVTIASMPAPKNEIIQFTPDVRGEAIQSALLGGKHVKLSEGTFTIDGGLEIPAGAVLEGVGQNETILQLAQEAGAHQRDRGAIGWGIAPSNLVSSGERLDYEIPVQDGGNYTVWLRYRYGNVPADYEQTEGFLRIRVGDTAPVPFKNTPHADTWKWSQVAIVDLLQGRCRFTLMKGKGGEIIPDALVFSKNSGWAPGENEEVSSSSDRLVVQCEDIIHMMSWQGRMPGRAYAAVWLSGDGATIKNLSLMGSNQFSVGVLIADDSKISWVKNVCVNDIRIADIDGRQMNGGGILIERAESAVIENSEIIGRDPIFIRGMRDSRISGNRILSVTRFGGNGEGYICSRNNILHHCIIEDNIFTSPYRGAGYTGRRMIWVSTGVGSVDNNIFKGNKTERANFGGLAGTDQNVGEMVLFEACNQVAYYGQPDASGERTVTLPSEGPAWPPVEGAEKELPLNANYDGDAFLGEYYLMVVKGTGLGQIRRVVGRDGNNVLLDKPWRIIPDKNSLILMSTLFVRNLVVDNLITDGMCGVQLWIGCVENVVADNIIERQHRQGIFVYGCFTTAHTNLPRSWNSGIGPCYYNHIEGNATDECANAITFGGYIGLASSGVSSGISWTPKPGVMDWPLFLGNVVRQNSCVRNRTEGIGFGLGRSKEVQGGDVPASIGNIVEFNLVRDALEKGISMGNLTDVSVVRRNHVYFWLNQTQKDLPIGIDLRRSKNCVESDNNVEDKHGNELRTPNRVVKE